MSTDEGSVYTRKHTLRSLFPPLKTEHQHRLHHCKIRAAREVLQIRVGSAAVSGKEAALMLHPRVQASEREGAPVVPVH